MGQPRSTYRLRSRTLLNELMDGEWSVRALAIDAKCSKTMIWNLKSGENETCSEDLANRITRSLGIKTKVLFAPVVSSTVDEASREAA